MAESLDEWIEKNGFKELERDIKIHIVNCTYAGNEDTERATRCIMISLQQEMEKRN